MPEAPKEKAEQTTLAEKNRRALQFIEEVTTNADKVQQRVLCEILSRNGDVEYLRRHGLNGRVDRESFKKTIPVIKYEDIQSDIIRIANGDKSDILSSEPISEFLTSSGTSGGERKLMPTINSELDRRTTLYSLLMPIMSTQIPNLEQGKGMYFLFIKSEFKTPSGLPARPVLTSYYKSNNFINRNKTDPYTNYTSPNETILCNDSYQSMYTQLLCGILDRNSVLRVGAVFASGFIRAIKFLEKHWLKLVRDIRTGMLCPEITDPDIKRVLTSRMLTKPDPELADFVTRECCGLSWSGIIRRLWPNSKYVDVIVTGTMAQYIPMLDYYSDGLPLVCTMYASSECYFGVNLNPLCSPSEVEYTLIPTMCYFEFLPVTRNQTTSTANTTELNTTTELVELVDVEVGVEYELVITTYAGLYRYRVGDILKVTGFKNTTPQFSFICRKNVILSIDSDKTDELQLQTAVQSATNHLQPFNTKLVEYTSYADTSTIPGHYVIYWELLSSSSTTITTTPASVFEDCCLTMEESLNSVYRQGRVSDKSIGPLEIRLVEIGTFDKVMDYSITCLGASINQYKTPRCVTFKPILDVLESRVVDRFFSPKCPKWVPGGGCCSCN